MDEDPTAGYTDEVRKELADEMRVPTSSTIKWKSLFSREDRVLEPLSGRDLLDIRKLDLTAREEFIAMIARTSGISTEEVMEWYEEDLLYAGRLLREVSRGDSFEEAAANFFILKCPCGVDNQIELNLGDFEVNPVIDEVMDLCVGDDVITFTWPKVHEVSAAGGSDIFCCTKGINEEQKYEILQELYDRKQGFVCTREFECVDCHEVVPYVHRIQCEKMGVQYVESLYNQLDLIGSWYSWSMAEILDMNDKERTYWALRARKNIEDKWSNWGKILSKIMGG